jgi:hypothetical protein
MLKSNKHVFWEALIITVFIFLLGILIGVTFEIGRTEKINSYYADSEMSLADIQLMQKLIDTKEVSCDVLMDANVKFANRIYEEARLLSKYEDAGKITDGIKLAHKRYDLLRTLLWMNSIETNKQCEDKFSVIVYLYEYEPKDLTKKAKQEVWSKILAKLKEMQGEKIILIPIAQNANITTLDTIITNLDIKDFPVVVINNKQIISELTSAEDLIKYLN